MSWNVAGLSKTVQRIHESTPRNETTTITSASSFSKKVPDNASLEAFFQRHGADIVCLQEHKIPKSQLANRSEPRQCSALANYESFWACSTNTNTMNFGVVTYCKQGSVARSNSTPLNCPELDEQGRCIMTDHGSFVLFNVYVPANGGQSLTFKMKFLRALRRAMDRERKQRQVPVILVGDLNIALGSKDIYWKDCVVYIDELLKQDEVDPETVPTWKREIRLHWPTIAAALETKVALPTTTTNTHTGEQFNKFRFAVTVEERTVYLGRHESTAEYCLGCYDFSEGSYFDEELQQTILAQESNAVRIQVLAELMSKIVSVQWSEETLREIYRQEASIRRVSPSRQWLRDLLNEDKMIDAFRHFYPNAEARFTCWHQFTNRRYVNDGSRIDATLVDEALLPHVRKGEVDNLRCGETGFVIEDPYGEKAALEAATANGRFVAVSFEGGGIQEVSQATIDTQFGTPHTGMIYTPPSFSDHIAISLLMDDSVLSRDLQLQMDASTRKAQPHKLQRSIAACFAAATSERSQPRKSGLVSRLPVPSQSTKPAASKRAKTSVAKTKPTNTLLHHFQKAKRKEET